MRLAGDTRLVEPRFRYRSTECPNRAPIARRIVNTEQRGSRSADLGAVFGP